MAYLNLGRPRVNFRKYPSRHRSLYWNPIRNHNSRFQKCNIVNNRRRGQTTAFGFLTFENLDDAREAKEDAHGMEIDGNM